MTYGIKVDANSQEMLSLQSDMQSDIKPDWY